LADNRGQRGFESGNPLFQVRSTIAGGDPQPLSAAAV
jgi:hypothetical protein